jgi:RNA polymerase sigma-70 factor (ECF subfamily)
MRAWLFGIMHNVHVDGARRRRIDTVPLDEHDGARAAEVAPRDRLALRDLQSSLDALPVEQKEVLLLVGLEDMSYADAARTLGVPIGTVMSRLSRGRERLRALMEGRNEPVHLKVVKQ